MNQHQALLIDTMCLEVSYDNVLNILSNISKVLPNFKVCSWKIIDNIQAINKYKTIQLNVESIDDSVETIYAINSATRDIIGDIFIRAMVYDGKRVNIYSL